MIKMHIKVWETLGYIIWATIHQHQTQAMLKTQPMTVEIIFFF